jgi:hypothetical protein
MGQEEQTSVKNISPTSSIGRIPDGLRSKIFESGDRGSNPLWEFRGEDLYKKQVNAAADTNLHFPIVPLAQLVRASVL